jgi:peptide subunit release factor RF-3
MSRDRLATIRVWSKTYEKGIKCWGKYHNKPALVFMTFSKPWRKDKVASEYDP